MFYNYCIDVPDAYSVRRRLLPLAGCARKHNHATDGGFYAVKTVNAIINAIRGRK